MIQMINFLLKLTLGLGIIGLLIWNRFFRIRIGYDIILVESITIIKLGILFFFALMFIVLFLVSLAKLCSFKILSDTNAFLEIKNKITNYFYDTLSTVYETIMLNFPEKWKIGEIIRHLGLFLYNNLSSSKNKILIVHMVFVILPRFILCLSFCHGIFIAKNLSIFFSLLILLIIPLIFNTIKYSLKHFSETNLNLLEQQYFDISYSNEQKGIIIKPKISFDSDIQFNDYVILWRNLDCISNLLAWYENETQKFFFIWHIFFYLLYACTWSYFFLIMLPKLSEL